MPVNRKIVGGYDGKLDNGGERIQLLRPDEPPLEDSNFIPLLLEDEVRYDDDEPWPVTADGTGNSLQRVSVSSWGNDVTSWQALPPTASVVTFPTSSVIGRNLIYNNSYFDGNDSTAGIGDEGAVASDKSPLLPGQTAAYVNYTNYVHGINGSCDRRGWFSESR